MTAAEEAKQLDSVTDVVQEKELDASKAQQAMTALATKSQKRAEEVSSAAAAVSKEDVALIVSELEVTDDVAARALRQVAEEVSEGKSVAAAALRKLVAS